jgi:nitroimidazol reductase NimA-like FMN-containing flavoprotein (pyridoxamine 5'-phosphate oxidase superfamily)
MGEMNRRTGLEVLSDNESLLLLGRSSLGRLVTVHEGRPLIFPVNFRRDGRTIVFRTDAGTKLDAVTDDRHVLFEVDELDERTRTGWSVIVHGLAVEVRDLDELRTLEQRPMQLWTPGAKSHFVRIVPTEISGRRIVHMDDAHHRPAP